jgi:two-component system cell cycle sensor histidine kinase/response regulator CckA
MNQNQDKPPDEASRLSQRAEAALRDKTTQSPENPDVLTPEEIQRLLHELRVHQIELEAQNEELRRAQLQLDSERARYFDLYDLAPVGYFTLSEQGLILEGNLTAAGLLRLVRSELVDQLFSHFILKEDQDLYYLHRKELFETGSSQAYELRMLRNDGAQFWAQLAASAAQDVDGAPVCRIVLSDISERKQVEVALREITQRKLLEQDLLRNAHLAVMGAVTAELAHEIKNPLQAILSNLELVLDFALDPHESQQQLRLCYHELERLVDLTNRLLNLAGPNQTVSRPFSVPELFQRILGLVEKSALAVGVSIDLVVPEGFPLILAEPDPMVQVLLNLSINAIEAMPHGGQLTLSAEAADETIRMNVINNGNISPASRIENIFELFYTTKSGGSGLGLPISHNIVQKMGGSLSADNLHHPDRVKFTITLPASLTQRGPVQTHPLASVAERVANPGEPGSPS